MPSHPPSRGRRRRAALPDYARSTPRALPTTDPNVDGGLCSSLRWEAFVAAAGAPFENFSACAIRRLILPEQPSNLRSTSPVTRDATSESPAERLQERGLIVNRHGPQRGLRLAAVVVTSILSSALIPAYVGGAAVVDTTEPTDTTQQPDSTDHHHHHTTDRFDGTGRDVGTIGRDDAAAGVRPSRSRRPNRRRARSRPKPRRHQRPRRRRSRHCRTARRWSTVTVR